MTTIRTIILGAVSAALLGLIAPDAALAAASVCDADAGNLVQNCGFETGDTTSWTEVGNHTTPYNFIVGAPQSGIYAYADGNFAVEGLAGLSQTIADVNGAIYDLSFWLLQTSSNSSTGQAYQVSWNGTLLLNESGASPGPYTQFTYGVTGTGSDTLQFEGYSDHGYNYVDDFQLDFVSGPQTGVPEPATLALFGAGLAGLGAIRRRKAKSSK